ncbi:MAG: phage terminase large subunit family protein, partial [Candidatus Peregrinibacteria bacterium]|nr:phage terminase large subunit family protein [Candidatus Peregrinibacteria bacterium]
HVKTKGDRMNFKDMPYLVQLYRDFASLPYLVVMKSVQCGLSELFIVGSFQEAAELGLTVFYVLPKYELRNRFVNNRVDKVIRRVGKYAELVREAGGSARVSLKHFGKGTLVYVGSNVEDEFLEIPVDSVYIDEKDRCTQSNLLLVPDRLTFSSYKYQREISNPTIEGFGIAERWEQSTKGSWYVRCDHCSSARKAHWINLDFFRHVVRQVDSNRYEARDPDWEYQKKEALIFCNRCHKPINRLKNGEWIEEHPGRLWVGRQIGKQINVRVSVGRMVDKWMDSHLHPKKRQVFFNSDLGLPYTDKGAKFTDGLLNSCQRDYVYPVIKSAIKGPLFMGVDVNSDLNVIIRERVKDEFNCWIRRLVLALTVPSFSVLELLIKEWGPKYVVIDANPEIHSVLDLKGKFKNVYSSRFSHGLLKMGVNKSDRLLSIDKTCLVDGLKSEFDFARAILPPGAEEIDDGQYYSQMKAATRILLTNENNPDKSYYSWEHSSPDDYMLAEAYCLQADLLAPRDSVIDFYTSFLNEEQINAQKNAQEMADQIKKPVDAALKFAHMDQNTFLNQLGSIYNKK